MPSPLRFEIATFGFGGRGSGRGPLAGIFGGGAAGPSDDFKRRALERAAIIVRRAAIKNVTNRFTKAGGRRSSIKGKSTGGHLRQSITHVVGKLGGEWAAQIGTNLPHGRFQELGTKGPYLIVPRKARALRFEAFGAPGVGATFSGPAKVGSRGIVFAKKVMHPGLKPKPWLSTAVQENQAQIRQIFRGEFDKWLKGGG